MTIRKAARLPVRLPISIGGRQAALSADVSDGGFRLETMSLLSPGARLEGYVLHGDKELTWKGEVAWARPGNPMASTWHELGVRFTFVSPGLRALISLKQKG
ncbi:MAG: PilZ domain-containing protein [Myxococcota bacterium]